ncbi:MAG: DUF302 domain-containing protein [Candidatus Competibacterales bacterium]|nr:DUF302 domain-containing protein [Candidatus Competibacterales bacterium]
MPRIVTLLLTALLTLPAVAADGLISVRSPHDVATTLDRLEAVLGDKGMTVFTRIDHAAGAADTDQTLPPTALILFGNPRVGTPLMQCSRSVAIDLPQKMLAWEDADGQVWLGYNDPAYLDRRHGLSGCAAVLEKVSAALAGFAAAATAE